MYLYFLHTCAKIKHKQDLRLLLISSSSIPILILYVEVRVWIEYSDLEHRRGNNVYCFSFVNVIVKIIIVLWITRWTVTHVILLDNFKVPKYIIQRRKIFLYLRTIDISTFYRVFLRYFLRLEIEIAFVLSIQFHSQVRVVSGILSDVFVRTGLL